MWEWLISIIGRYLLRYTNVVLGVLALFFEFKLMSVMTDIR